MNDDQKPSVEEKDLLKSYDRGEWRSVNAVQERLEQYQVAASAMLEADGLISIILPKEDLQALQRKADAAGVPYQKMIANIVHQFLAGRLIEKTRS
jgi:predicted DNA binding CopG/RHH family protein